MKLIKFKKANLFFFILLCIFEVRRIHIWNNFEILKLFRPFEQICAYWKAQCILHAFALNHIFQHTVYHCIKNQLSKYWSVLKDNRTMNIFHVLKLTVKSFLKTFLFFFFILKKREILFPNFKQAVFCFLWLNFNEMLMVLQIYLTFS